MSKLFRFYIDEINRTKSPYTSEVLTDLFVVADNLEDARRIAENRLRTITAEKQKHKEEDDKLEQKAKEEAKKNEQKYGLAAGTWVSNLYDLESRSTFEIEGEEEIEDGIGEVYYIGTG